jgi:hypothetical protein
VTTLQSITSPAVLYSQYLTLRKTSPQLAQLSSFYYDIAELLSNKNEIVLATRVVTNLAELDLENPHLLRVMGFWFEQMDFKQQTINVYRRVLKYEFVLTENICKSIVRLEKESDRSIMMFRLRPEEPQSLWNLILALTNHAIAHYDKLKQQFMKRQWRAIGQSQCQDTKEQEQEQEEDQEEGQYLFWKYTQNLTIIYCLAFLSCYNSFLLNFGLC